ncbi:hypothetical protein G3576_24130 [Roseomonas stagni]|uniref:PhnA-like protein n=2 Tax=Falsiroseomonas algicola TaxID=2716930 RepID=A0A6M1LSX8_9PROT|nr:hypothetical protein [Falsiroseomonas algicola]
MLNILGLAIGATTIDPVVAGETPSASTFGIAGGIWLLVANLIGLAVGGYVAARLSGTADDTDGVLHGLSVWAIGFLISAVLLGNAAAGAVNGVSRMVGGAAQGLGQGAGEAISAVAPAAREIDPRALAERLQAGLQTGGDPAAMTTDQRRAEMAQIVGNRISSGSADQGARDRLSQLVAAEYGIPAEEARTRVDRLEAEATRVAQEAETRARAAADAAANGAAVGAYWIFAAMLLGAVAAVLGARTGTRTTVRAMDRRLA